MSYNSLLSFGDLIPLKLKCNVKKLFDETEEFVYLKYNPRKDIERYGLSITSLDGSLNGIDLDSIKEYNKENNTEYDELSFNKFTDVYNISSEIQKIVEPFKNHIGRSIVIDNEHQTYYYHHLCQ